MKKLRPFIPTREKLESFVLKLKDRYLYLSDENRNEAWISMLIAAQMFGPRKSAWYEIGDWQGMIAVVDIIPGWRGEVLFKIWDKSAWGPDLCRDILELKNTLAREFGIRRFSIQTPDESMTKLVKFIGFEQEGQLKDAFMWDGKLYDLNCFSCMKEA